MNYKIYRILANNLDQAYVMKTSPNGKRPHENHIYDENETVIWNKEKAKIEIQKYEEKCTDLREKRINSINKAEEELITQIIKDTNFNEKICKKLYDFAYNRSYTAEQAIEVLEELIKIFTENGEIK